MTLQLAYSSTNKPEPVEIPLTPFPAEEQSFLQAAYDAMRGIKDKNGNSVVPDTVVYSEMTKMQRPDFSEKNGAYVESLVVDLREQYREKLGDL